MPEDEVICDSFQPILSEIERWLPHMPRHCEGTLRGIVKYLASSTITALISVREVKRFEVAGKGPRSEKKITSSLNQLIGYRLTEGTML
ncbi:hypothetical protein AVEN_178338-1 [Araneus ventricosus]|uniref:Uncharacterized protein n=1 Tax=Araneus ventricosus TaxID=182803 RepID=A0A4Y2BEF4_ARAVE|nr:hypothetical protein AVEN_178338-1 [Araneus ventricosus]